MNVSAVVAGKRGTGGGRTALLATQTTKQLLHSYSNTKQQLNFTRQPQPPSYKTPSTCPCSPYHRSIF